MDAVVNKTGILKSARYNDERRAQHNYPLFVKVLFI
jgi:hypothetical protein